jgi:nicotinamide riboside kinase
MARYIGDFANINWAELEEKFFIAFAKSQFDMIETMKLVANKVLFVDSDNLTTQIYADTYIGMKNDYIKTYDKINYNLYLLMKPDCSFVQDGTRIYKNKRWEIHKRFKQELINNKRPFIEIGGDWEERYCTAVDITTKIIM